MGEVQRPALRDGLETQRRQHYRLAKVIGIQIAKALQTGLHNLFIGMCSAGNPIDILLIIDLLDISGLFLTMLDDRQRDVRFQCHQFPVCICKGNDAVRYQKILVSGIEVIFLEFAHFIAKIAVSPVQGPQFYRHLFVHFQNAAFHHISHSNPVSFVFIW